MSSPLAAIAFAALFWWLSTGAILWLMGVRRIGRRTIVAAATVGLGLAMGGLAFIARDASVSGAYAGFCLGVAVWGWHELSFLLGVITGPRKGPADPDAPLGVRFRQATAALIHHELAIAVNAVVLAALLWKAPNQIGLWTFLVLWGMRLSAKANIFLGVPNLTVEFVPPHLAYLQSYFRKGPATAAFAVSVAAGLAVVALFAHQAISAAPGDLWVTGGALVAALAALGVIEHFFLVLPVRDSALWAWAARNAKSGAKTRGAHAATRRCDAADRASPAPWISGYIPLGAGPPAHAIAPYLPVELTTKDAYPRHRSTT